MNAAKLIADAREFRDASISRVQPPLSPLPSPLPKNVTRIANTILTPEELKITSYNAVELIQAIREKIFTCEAVTRAFLRRAALAQKLVILHTTHINSIQNREITKNRQIASQNYFPNEPLNELNI